LIPSGNPTKNYRYEITHHQTGLIGLYFITPIGLFSPDQKQEEKT